MTLLLCLRTFAAALPPREEHLAPRFGRARYPAMAKYGTAKIKRGGKSPPNPGAS
jgi:hypothetical protein